MGRLTIEELAAATGMSTRNIREHQTRGLLQPPEIEGRKGFYDERHVARLRLVLDLQEQGLNLQAISWILDRAPVDAADEVVRLREALFAPWTEEEPAVFTLEELRQRWSGSVSGAEAARVTELGLLRPLDDGRFEAPSPRLLDAGEELVSLGIPVAVALDVVETVRAHSEAIAASFVGLFVEQVWEPFVDSGLPADRWAEVRDALERLRPIASDTVLAVFQQTMTTAVETTLADVGPPVGEQTA